MVHPIIKRPGGKYQEYNLIKSFIPTFERYVEPFFGGGGVFFRLAPKKAVINDVCPELMQLYSFIKDGNKKFRSDLNEYVGNWEKVDKYISIFLQDYILRYGRYKKNELSDEQFTEKIRKSMQEDINQFNGLFNNDFSVDNNNLLLQITKNIINKLKRVKALETEKGDLPEGDLVKNIETGFRSGFYMHFRDLMNFADKYKISLSKKVANYYFIREFCYASMFRYNKNGHFNIPYGGIAYNNKDFKGKVDYMFSSEVQLSFKGTEIYNLDYSNILNNKFIKKNDFIFIDPPYDTEFDDYHGDKFTKNDQERLAKSLYTINGKFLLIIKNTEYILSLYKNKTGIKIESFEKKYAVSIQGRNNQNVEHLVVYKY